MTNLLADELLGEHILVVVAHLKEALEARRRVLGALSLVAVREEHGEPRLTEPLLLSRRDELIDHALRRVGEVSELRGEEQQEDEEAVAVEVEDAVEGRGVSPAPPR